MALRVIEDDKLIDDGYEHILRRAATNAKQPYRGERLLRVMWAARRWSVSATMQYWRIRDISC